MLCHQAGGLGVSPVMEQEGRGSFTPLPALTALQKLVGTLGQSPEGLQPQPAVPHTPSQGVPLQLAQGKRLRAGSQTIPATCRPSIAAEFNTFSFPSLFYGGESTP